VKRIERVVVLGANGAMGAGSGETFAAAGITTTFLARDRDKAERGRARAISMAKSEAISRYIHTGGYEDLSAAVAEADLVLEAVGEELSLKRQFFDLVERHRRDDSIIASVSSGLSMAAMAAGRSESFRKHFLGVHLFNPPNVIVGTEVVPTRDTDPALTAFVIEFLERRLGRKVIETSDTPAFAGNRVGFKVLNEVAQLAAEHGVLYLDTLLGPHTGRAMAPLATIDFVGWDIHRAIVDNLHAHTSDEAHGAFALPGYMAGLAEAGHLGNKTPDRGGFFRQAPASKDAAKGGKGQELWVLDPARGEYRPAVELATEPPEIVRRMKSLHRVGRYREALGLLLTAEGHDAELMRRVVLGYVSYGLGRVGEVVRAVRDVDRIMGFGFNWAPPGLLVDLCGARPVIDALERMRLPVPRCLVDHAERGQRLFTEPFVDPGRFFHG
jgi:3-hydroxyacyl-CoA dehydrogenase